MSTWDYPSRSLGLPCEGRPWNFLLGSRTNLMPGSRSEDLEVLGGCVLVLFLRRRQLSSFLRVLGFKGKPSPLASGIAWKPLYRPLYRHQVFPVKKGVNVQGPILEASFDRSFRASGFPGLPGVF